MIVEVVGPIREGQDTLEELLVESEKRIGARIDGLSGRIDMVAKNTNAQFAEIEKRLPG